MGKILECGESKTFQNLEQCHEIQGEFKKSPLCYLKPPFNNKEINNKNKNNNIKKAIIDDQENELNVINYNNEEFCQGKNNDKTNLVNNEKESYIDKVMDSIKLKKSRLNKSFGKIKKKEKSQSFRKINNLLEIKDENSSKKFISNDIANIELKNGNNKRLNYNNTDININNKSNENKKIKKEIDVSQIKNRKLKKNVSQENLKQNNNRIINNIFKNEKNRQMNYISFNKINTNKILDMLDRNKESKKFEPKKDINKGKIKKQNKPIKRNKSYQIIKSFKKSENMISSKVRNSFKEKKGNYVITPKVKAKFPLYMRNKNQEESTNESRRKTYLTTGNNSPKSINDKYFKRNEENIFNNLKNASKNNNTFGSNNSKKNFYKFIPHNKSEKYLNPFISLQKNKDSVNEQEKNLFDFNLGFSKIKRKYNSNNIINHYKKDTNENEFLTKNIVNKDIIKVKIAIKGTQINQTLLNSSVNNIYILNYNILSKISNKAVLYDGNIYKVINSKKGETKLVLRYFQITKLYFRYYNCVQSLVLPNIKPLEFFEIKKIKNIEIIDINLLKDKNEFKIKFSFVINLEENINFFIFATNDREIGMNIINILNLIKKYNDEEKDFFK